MERMGTIVTAAKCNRLAACQAPTELAKGNQLPF
jgi:hypothetical protein